MKKNHRNEKHIVTQKGLFVIFAILTIFLNSDCVFAKNSQNNMPVGIYSVGNMHSKYPYQNKTIVMDNGQVLVISGSDIELFNPQNNKFKLVSKDIYFGEYFVNLDENKVLGYYSRKDNNSNLYKITFNVYDNKTNIVRGLATLTSNKIFVGCVNPVKISDDKIFIANGKENYTYNIKDNILSNNISISDKEFIQDKYSNGRTDIIKDEYGNILIFGMSYYKKNDPAKKKNYVFKYNPNTDSISYAGKLAEERIDKIKVFKFDKENLIVIGGRKQDSTNSADSVRTIEKYNIKNGTSEIIGNLSVPYNYNRAVLLDNKKILFNIPSSYCLDKYCHTYKPFVQDLEKNTSEYTEGGSFNYISVDDPTVTKLKDGSILFSGGAHNGLDSKRSYRYYYKRN